MGACEECDGIGVEKYFDDKKIVPDDSRSILNGAIKPWETKVFGYQKKFFVETISKILKVYKVDIKTPWYKIPNDIQSIILYGDENSNESFISDFEGIINFIDRKYSETERWWVQYELEKYLSERDCEVCNGFRLNKKALAVKIANHHIGEITKKSIDECFDWFNKLKQNLSPNENKIAEGVKEFGHKNVEYIGCTESVVPYLQKILKPGDVVMALGAGNIGELSHKLVTHFND